MKKRIWLLLAFVLLLCCAMPAMAKPTLNRTETNLYPGKSKTLKVKGYKGKVTWSSSDKTVVKVSKDGVITGKNPGQATITAAFGEDSLTCSVTVKSLRISDPELSLEVGQKVRLKLYCGFQEGIKWKISDNKVLKICGAKKNKVWVKGRAAGTATLTATFKKKTYTCVVTVKAPASHWTPPAITEKTEEDKENSLPKVDLF
jgi:uncharacterized protein YjdB